MLLQSVGDVRGLLSALRPRVIGVGMTAYARVTPSYFLEPYQIITLRKTRDLAQLRERSEVFCLQEETNEDLSEAGFNAASLMAHPSVRHLLGKLPGPKCLLPYQSYTELESLAREEGWTVLANSASLRGRVTQRAFFKHLVEHLQLRRIRGGIHPIEEIYSRPYEYWLGNVGPHFVLQLPDIVQGSGKGTFFVRSPLRYQEIQRSLRGRVWRGVGLKSVSIHAFQAGVPASIAACVTRHGVLLSGLQRQLIDLPYCRGAPEDGVFCGHAWTLEPWPVTVQSDAREQTRTIGEHLAGLGYRGIFGVDFLVDERQQQVFPIEINPRLTGAFPMLSLLHLGRQVIPLEAFHMLEFLNLPYQADINEFNEAYGTPLQGSHILVYPGTTQTRIKTQELRPGVYESDPESGTISFLKEGLGYQNITSADQFIIADGPPDRPEGAFVPADTLYRLCRVLFPYPVVDYTGVLSQRAQQTIDWVYGRMTGNIPCSSRAGGVGAVGDGRSTKH